jgi:type I restriction enzyme, S subunit
MPSARLRTGWTRVAFGDVVALSREHSSDPDGDGLKRYVGLDHLEPGDLTIRRWGNVLDGTTFTNVFRSGQVLFGKRRAYLRKVAVADFDGVCSGDIYVLQPKVDSLLLELLPFICQTDSFFQHAVGTSAGSLSPRTNWDSLASYEFSLPPLDEQVRIVPLLLASQEVGENLQSLLEAHRCLRLSALAGC